MGPDECVDLHRVNQPWLDAQLAANALRPHVFFFGHEPAFKAFHSDCLGSYPTDRNVFWSSLATGGARVTFAGHDHFFDALRIDDGDGDADDLGVSLTRKRRILDPITGAATYVPANVIRTSAALKS